MLSVMTDPEIVSGEVVDEGWTVKSLLLKIAQEPYETR